jgi:hypothetical protein
MSKSTSAVPTRITTGKARLSYVTAFQPKAIQDGQTPKYSVSVLIPKTDTATLARIEKAIDAAIAAAGVKLANKAGKLPPKSAIKTPLRDGDTEKSDDEDYAGCFFINANSLQKPQVVDAELNPIIDPLELYSGCYGRVSLNFYAFDTNGNKGIAAGLGNIQKLEDGAPLGSVTNASADFGEDNDDDI